MFGRLSCAFFSAIAFHITPVSSTTESAVIYVLCWCNSTLLCLTLSHITSRLLLAEDTEHCEHHELKTTDCYHTEHIHGVYI